MFGGSLTKDVNSDSLWQRSVKFSMMNESDLTEKCGKEVEAGLITELNSVVSESSGAIMLKDGPKFGKSGETMKASNGYG